MGIRITFNSFRDLRMKVSSAGSAKGELVIGAIAFARAGADQPKHVVNSMIMFAKSLPKNVRFDTSEGEAISTLKRFWEDINDRKL